MARLVNRCRQKFLTWVLSGLAFSGGMAVNACKPEPIRAAERIRVALGPLDLSISLDSLEAFAKEGTIAPDLKLFASRLNPRQTAVLRQLLQQQLPFDVVLIDRLTYVQLGESLLRRLGLVIQPHYDVNGFHAIRSALILAAASEAGLSPLNVIRQFPTPEIRVDANVLLDLLEDMREIPQYQAAIAQAVSEQAQREAVTESIDPTQLRDLGEPGPYRFTKQTIAIDAEAVRQTQAGLVGAYSFPVDLYIPEGLTQPAPLIVMTHGFGSTRTTYDYVLKHLASQGFVVAAPEHIGSNLYYRQVLLTRFSPLRVDISPLEFINRPLEVSYTIDKIEQLVKTDPAWAKRVNLNQIGVLGNSFGATTALSVAGATINVPRLRQECVPEKHLLNLSVLLQCRAEFLPPQPYNFADPRVKAVFAAYPLSSVVYGPEGMGSIAIPTFILAGSRDVFTPVGEEQISPFIWLNTPNKYLGLMINGTHFSTATDEINASLPGILRSPGPELGRKYIYALSTAFFNAYLANRQEYLPYLTSAYAETYGQEPLKLKVIESLTPAQLETAFGGPPVVPIVPPPVTTLPPVQVQGSVLQQIQRTGELRVAYRSDAPPLGYVDPQKQVWTGYCADLIDAMRDYLSRKLNDPITIETVPLQSTLANRFDLVRDRTIYLECGPNTVRSDVDGVIFSNPFFATGTQFLVRKGEEAKVKPPSPLTNMKTGVLKGSLTADFLQQNYPQAQTVLFDGQTGRAAGIKALTAGEIGTFAGDGVLSLGEVLRQNLPIANYSLVPEQPLSCDFYGLILPADDRQWQATVNEFLASEQARQVRQTWFKNTLPQALENADFCLNRLNR